MLQLVIILFGTAALFLAAFHIIKILIMIFTGCSEQEAIRKIHNFFTENPPYHAASDPQLNNMLWSTVRAVIGEQRFHDLENLAVIIQIYWTGRLGGLPCIALTVICENDNEKARLESALKANLSQCLQAHGLPGLVLTRWDVNPSVQLPVLVMQYAETESERKIITEWLKQNNKKILSKHHSVKDEEVELDE